MAFVPSKRLLWGVAVGVMPAWLWLGMTGVSPGVLALGLGSVACFALLDALISLRDLDGVMVKAESMVRVTRGGRFAWRLELEGGGVRGGVMRLGIAFPKALKCETEVMEVCFEAGKPRGIFRWEGQALERGSFEIRQVYLGKPSRVGLWEIRREVPVQCEVRVYPDLSGHRDVLAPLFLRRASPGIHSVRQIGRGREFEQLRAYAPGDGYEDIYWKGTAKRRFPVTRVYQTERTQEIYVAVDVSRRSARVLEGSGSGAQTGMVETQCDRFLQAALVLALTASQQGDRLGLVTFSDQVHSMLPASGGSAHYAACREALYALHPRRVNPDYAELFTQIGNRVRRRSLVIVLTDLGEAWLAETFREAVRELARKHLVLVHFLGSREASPLFGRDDGLPDADALYGRLAGHMVWSGLEKTARKLSQSGVHLVRSDEERLVAEVVSEYLKVKKRQIL
ncbi:MAG: hypothetical protein RLZZ244_1800 [Verrucomicrobiota bacterium]|jgi:uncharacterized protein (DUF58 family)